MVFMSYQENLDLGTASGRRMMHMVAAMVEFEREIIREHVRAGLANARKKGKRLGSAAGGSHRPEEDHRGQATVSGPLDPDFGEAPAYEARHCS